jgi:putative resolvase
LVEAPESQDPGAVLYPRVSLADHQADRDRQVARLGAFAADRGICVAKVVAEGGSGLNGHRTGLMAVLRSPEYGMIVVEHRDRLAPWGSESIAAALAASGRRLIVGEPDAGTDDVGPDRIVRPASKKCVRAFSRRASMQSAPSLSPARDSGNLSATEPGMALAPPCRKSVCGTSPG